MAETADTPNIRDVYISYSGTDEAFARIISKSLQELGISVWVELGDLSSETDWQIELDRRLDSSDTFIFIISGDSIHTTSCLRELDRAVGLGKRVIPILRQHVSPELLPRGMDLRNGIDFSNDSDFERPWNNLIQAIRSRPTQTITPPPAVEATSDVPPTTKQESSTTIRLQAPTGTTIVDFSATPALARLLTKATRINRAFEAKFDLSFMSMLLAFLASDDPLSQWFVRYVKDADFAIDVLLKMRNLERMRFERIAAPGFSELELSTLDRPRMRTESAKKIFDEADKLRGFYDQTVDSSPDTVLDVRHLMAAYIYFPAGHETELDGLGFNRLAWSNAFLGQIKKLYPQELGWWSGLHSTIFGQEPNPVDEIEGPSTHIASDMWTLNDTLGYRAYAHAIYRFMTHKQTKPPLTISIQAPWGGGKTSLMRMIQHALDPDALKEVKAETKQPRGELTIKATLGEIENWISAKTQEGLPTVPDDKDRKLLTVWFNAWKYESVNQVWAGLVDAIMQQIAARLPLHERELFWLRLNLKRVDADKLRQRIHERIVRYWWRGLRYWLIGLGCAIFASMLAVIAGWLAATPAILRGGATGAGLTFAGSIIVAALKYLGAQATVKKEPAAVSLSEYLDIPNYSAETGFVHRVEADLRRVLSSVPAKYFPIVIFIDDLDRCSPVKVAQVVEAVNLFLAGDFPNCMFIMGMDTEMVAAALQSAHKEMISSLPADAGIPVGWRFMDKFVQLPFIIPPTEEGNLTRYTTSLFSYNQNQAADPQVDQLALEAATRITTRTAVDGETERLRVEHNLSEAQVIRMKDQIEARVVERKLDEGIEKFTDQNPEIQNVISAATSYFRGNPRELKRFINSFRFQYFLWWAQRAQGLNPPSLEQLRRWTVLSMKWPEVVRWLRRSGGSEWRVTVKAKDNVAKKAALPTRLKLLEDISESATDLATWQANALKDLRLDPKTTPWLNDDDLLQFFYEECENYASGQRLSDGLGKGLW